MKKLVIFLIAFILTGCASKEETAAYYHALEVIAHENTLARERTDIRFAEAMERLKGNPAAIVALALSRNNSRSGDTSTPDIKPPPSLADNIRAFTPLASTGIMWGAGAWAVNKIVKGAGTIVNAGGDGYVNESGDNNATTSSWSGSFDVMECIVSPPAGFKPDTGTPLYSPSCPCISHAEGKC